MGLFKSKAEKAQERKMQVRRSMQEMEKRIKKLEAQRAQYVNMAQIAIREDLPDQIKLAREAIKMTESERKRTYKMLLNAKIVSQMKDMTEMTGEFLKAMQVISKDIAGTTTADINKISNDLRIAMDRVSDQTEELSDMMEDSQDDVTEFSTGTSLVSDDDVDKLIYGTANGTASDTDSEIDAELAELKKKLDS